jgi:hypothetical protein
MITEVINRAHCNSEDIGKNGFAPNNGKQKYLSTMTADVKAAKIPLLEDYTEERKEEILLRAYQERSSLRGLRRTVGVSLTTVISCLKP